MILDLTDDEISLLAEFAYDHERHELRRMCEKALDGSYRAKNMLAEWVGQDRELEEIVREGGDREHIDGRRNHVDLDEDSRD